jgi:protein TonB
VTQVVAPVKPPPARVAPIAATGAQVAGPPAVAAPGATASAGGTTGTGDAASTAAQEGAYLKGLTQAIARNRFYPPEAQRQDVSGVVVVAFTIRADGSLMGFHVAKGSGSDVIDQAAVETVRRLGRYKPIPAGIGRSQWPVKVPIRFDLH